MIPTADPDTFIESCNGDATIYQRKDGMRWRVTGKCDRRGHCMVGAVVCGVTIKSVEHLNALCKKKGKARIESDLDVPVGPGFKDCCPFVIELLNK